MIMPQFNINEIDKHHQWLFRKKPNKIIPLLPSINRDEFNEAINEYLKTKVGSTA